MDWDLMWSIKKEGAMWLVLDPSGNVLFACSNKEDAERTARQWCDDPERKSNSSAVMD